MCVSWGVPRRTTRKISHERFDPPGWCDGVNHRRLALSLSRPVHGLRCVGGPTWFLGGNEPKADVPGVPGVLVTERGTYHVHLDTRTPAPFRRSCPLRTKRRCPLTHNRRLYQVLPVPHTPPLGWTLPSSFPLLSRHERCLRSTRVVWSSTRVCEPERCGVGPHV